MTDTITPLPVGNSTTLTWVGGIANNDPTNASNWNPQIAPQMAANQILDMTQGTMNLDGGNLQANQLHVNTGHDNIATINLTDHGTLDLTVPDGAETHANVNMSGGGEAVMNLFAGTTENNNADVNISIDSSKLDFQANMSFGQLSIHGGTTVLQGDTHINGSHVILDTQLSGFASIGLGATGPNASLMEFKTNLPFGLIVNALDSDRHVSGPNGMVFDTLSTTPGGQVYLTNAFAEIATSAATSYTLTNGELDLFNNGTKIDALNIAAQTGSSPLSVGVANGNTFVYNCDASSLPLGSSSGSGMNAFVASGITPLPMHA